MGYSALNVVREPSNKRQLGLCIRYYSRDKRRNRANTRLAKQSRSSRVETHFAIPHKLAQD